MRFCAFVLASWTVLASTVAGTIGNDTADGTSIIAQIFSHSGTNLTIGDAWDTLPTCSRDCLIEQTWLNSIRLDAIDLTSSCLNDTMQASVSACVQKQCNQEDELMFAIFNHFVCMNAYFPSRAKAFSVWALVLGPIALLAIALRCYSRVRLTREFGKDDWMMLSVGCVIVVMVALYVTNAMNGFGRHFWDLNPIDLPDILKILWVLEILYVLATTMIRVSIQLFYFRVFPTKVFRKANSVALAIVLTSGFAFIMATLFQCTPVSGVWNRKIESKCVDINSLVYAIGGVSVTLDVVVLLLPVRQLSRLQTTPRQKFHLSLIFGLGSLACITSCVRLRYIMTFSNSVDQTWDNAIPMVWSLAEIAVATVCACLPALRVLGAKLYPSAFDLNATHAFESRTDSKSLKRRSEKFGPTYSRRVIRTTESEMLDTFDKEEAAYETTFETRIWVEHPAPTTKPDHLRSLTHSITRPRTMSSLHSLHSKSSSSSNRRSDSTNSHRRNDSTTSFSHARARRTSDFEEEIGNALQTPCPETLTLRSIPETQSHLDRGIIVVDTFSIESRKIPVDGETRPVLPQHAIPSEWNEKDGPKRERRSNSSVTRFGQYLWDRSP